VVTALAETPVGGPAGQPPLTVPVMATLPKVDHPLAGPGPVLAGPDLAQAAPPNAPPNLSVIGARRLPPVDASPDEPPAGKRLPWGLIGLGGGLLAAAIAFRRRWSAASAKRG